MSFSDTAPSTSRGRGQSEEGNGRDSHESRIRIKLDPPLVKRVLKKSVAFSSSSSSTSSASSVSRSRSRSRSSRSKPMSLNETWYQVHRRVCSYLEDNRLDVEEVCKTRSAKAEKQVHALLASLSRSKSSSRSTGGRRSGGGARGHHEIDVEMYILFKLLGMIEHGNGKQRLKIGTEERTLLLKLVVWALDTWKTVAAALKFSKDRKSIVFRFEHCFLETLKQIRIESALCTKVDPSKKCLQLLNLLKMVQKLWVELQMASDSLNGENEIVDSVEEKVVKDIEEKTNLPNVGKEVLLFFERFDGMRERLGHVCKDSNGGGRESKMSRSRIAIQGMLINEMVQLFCESAKTDPDHRDHYFLNQLLHGTAMSGRDYKRALVWVIMKILPSMKEKSCGPVRLINTSQGLIRNVLQQADTQTEREEVSIWKQILQHNLETYDLALFYSVVLPKRIMDKFPPTDKTYDDFYSIGKSKEVIVGIGTDRKIQLPRNSADLVVSFSNEEESESSDPWEVKATVDWDMVPEK